MAKLVKTHTHGFAFIQRQSMPTQNLVQPNCKSQHLMESRKNCYKISENMHTGAVVCKKNNRGPPKWTLQLIRVKQI
jgi:hypothetical protein